MTDSTPDKQTNFHGAVTGSAIGGGTVNARNIAGGDIHEHHHHAPQPEKPTFPIHEIAHPQNPNFTGRKQILQQVAAALSAGQTTVVTQTIAGLGGVGKTQLALAYSYAHRGSYDLIYWLSADSEPGLGEDLMTLARRLKLMAPEATDQKAAVQAVLHWLGQTTQRWLLVYDNADMIEPGQLTNYLPRSGNGHVLITSRNPNYGGVGRVLELGLFALDEAVDFLFRRKEAKGEKVERGSEEWQEAATLAEALGRLPLALEHAAAYVESKGSSYGKYHELFTRRQKELWQRAERPERYHATITTTWELAFDEIKKTPGALDLLNLCCFLDPESIPLALIQQIANVGAQRAAPLQAVVADELALDDALGALRRYSLVQRAAGDLKSQQAEGALTLHRLAQAVARLQMGEELAQEWAATAIELVTSDLPDWHHLHAWEEGPQLLPHMIAAADLGAATGLETERLAFLDNWTGFFLQFRGEYRIARPFYECALAIREKALGPVHPDTATSLNNLGGLLGAMGNYQEALPYVKNALEIWEKQLGADHPDVGVGNNHVGYLLDSMGDLAGARPFFERALAIDEKALGPDHPDTATDLNNLGYLLRAMGDLAGARPFYERALAIREKALGPDHPDTAQSLNNLGALLQAMGDLAGARPFFERALAIKEKALGPDHPDTAQSLNNLGGLLQDMGDLTAARPFYERTLAILEKALGPDHPTTAASLNNLGSLLYAMGDLAAARPFLERALAIYEKRLGPNHPYTSLSRNGLAIMKAKISL